jgi:hypothetical protein
MTQDGDTPEDQAERWMRLDRTRRIEAETCKIEEGSLRGDQLALAYSNRALAYLGHFQK